MTCNEVRRLAVEMPIHTQPYELRQRCLEHVCGCAECRRWIVARASWAVRRGRGARRGGPGDALTPERVGRLDRAFAGPEHHTHLQELLRRGGGWDEIPEEILREVAG